MPSASDAPWRPEPGEILSVGELVARTREVLEHGFAGVWVEGEVSNLRVPASGHAYFTLGDESAQLRAVCFRTVVRLLPVELENGVHLLARGRLTVYEARGDLQLVVEDAEPMGEGLARLELEALKRRLADEGLFAVERKRSLPALPRAVGVVTSPTGAAVRDVLQVLGRRAPGMPVVLAPARVQGDGAAEELRDALALAAAHPEVDVIILGRGGGSAEDLSPFNDEALVRAVAACPVPVITAVGHETDVTLVDHAADLRAPTPSAAAELAVRDRERLAEQLRRTEQGLAHALYRRVGDLRQRLERADPRRGSPATRVARLRIRVDRLVEMVGAPSRRCLQAGRSRLGALETRLAARAPEHWVEVSRERLRRLEENLQGWPEIGLGRRRAAAAGAEGRLRALGPLAVLARGYAIVRRPGGGLVRDAAATRVGEDLELRLDHGELGCRVTEVRPEGS
jgi:exodeoxyribonuclease VII large subunit